MSLTRFRSAISRHWAILMLLALFGALYGTTLMAYGMFMWDEAEYASITRSVVRGEGFAISAVPHDKRLPVLPLAGAASMLLTGEHFEDSVLGGVSWCFALLAILCVYAFVAMVFNRSTGFIAA